MGGNLDILRFKVFHALYGVLRIELRHASHNGAAYGNVNVIPPAAFIINILQAAVRKLPRSVGDGHLDHSIAPPLPTERAPLGFGWGVQKCE